MQLRGGSRESGFKEPYKIYISIIIIYRPLHPIPGGCDLAVDRKCAFGAIKCPLTVSVKHCFVAVAYLQFERTTTRTKPVSEGDF